MAPEQITAQPVDGRTDVYSLGCIAYRCLTGTVPYPRDYEVAVMYAHLQETPPTVTAVRPELPGEVDKVVRKAMAKARDARFATCTEFVEALRPRLTGTTSESRKAIGRRPGRTAAARAGAPQTTPGA